MRQFVAALLLLGAGCVSALDPSLATSQYQVSQWRTANGLPHSSISALFEDRDGFIWAGTYRGAARFDGQRFLPLAELIGQPLQPDLIETIAQTEDGVLWFGGTYRDLVLLAPDGEVRTYGNAQGLVNLQITSVSTDADGQRWLGTRDGLLRVDGPWNDLKFSADLDQVVWQIVQWQGSLYAATEGGIWRRDAGEWQHLFDDSSLANVHVWSLEPDGERLWIGYRGGLAWFDGKTLKLIGRDDGLPHSVIRDLASDRDGNLWIGTAGAGIARLREGRFAVLDTSGGIAGDVTWEMVLGRDDTLWAASASGLSRLKNARVRNFGLPEGLRSGMVWGVMDDRRGGKYFAYNGDGLAHLDALGAVTNFGIPEGAAGAGIIMSMELDGEDVLMATFAGLYRLRDGRYERVAAVPAQRVHALRRLGDGDVLLGMQGGLWRLHGDQLTRIESPLIEPVLRLVPEKDGSLLVAAGRGGIWRLRGSRLEQLLAGSDMTVRDVFRASDGRLYAAGLGLFVLTEGRLLPITPVNRIMISQLHAIAESADRSLWINSNLGVVRVELDDIDAWITERQTDLPFEVVDESDGMRSSEGNGGGQNSLHMDRDGALWLATTAGIVAIDTRSTMLPEPPPLQARFERMLEDGQPRFARSGQRVAAGVRRLQVEYTVANPGAADALTFDYRLDPLDHDWVNAGRLRTLSLDRPVPGQYRLTVRARHGESVGQSAQLDFSVEAFWWQNPWVLRGVWASVALLLALAFRMRVLRLRHQRDLLEREVAARTSELAAANAQLADAARRDFLTGVGNRRHFTERINRLWSQPQHIALAVIDVDHFKIYNDHLGHLAGDACLRAIGALFNKIESAEVEAFRVGGEEFALIASGTAAEQLAALLTELRSELSAAAMPHPASAVSSFVTLSAGMARRRGDDVRPEDLYARADAALYRAKSEGRDRIISET